jgi:hypothetical protein
MSATKDNHDNKKEGAKATFACEKCDKKYGNLEQLKKHKEIHKDDSLEKLKDEILDEVKKKNKKRLSWDSGLVTAILVVLTIVSIMQTAQSANILSKINSGDFKSSGTSSSTALPSSLENLPNMVGGC